MIKWMVVPTLLLLPPETPQQTHHGMVYVWSGVLVVCHQLKGDERKLEEGSTPITTVLATRHLWCIWCYVMSMFNVSKHTSLSTVKTLSFRQSKKKKLLYNTTASYGILYRKDPKFRYSSKQRRTYSTERTTIFLCLVSWFCFLDLDICDK